MNHWAAYATIGKQYPHVRNVIIRESSPQKLVIYTHSLSQKIEDIKLTPHSTVCWYSPDLKMQLIFYGKSHLNQDRARNVETTISDLSHYKGAKPGTPFIKSDDQIHFDIIEFNYKEVIALKLMTDQHIKYKFLFHDRKAEGLRVIP